MKIPCEIICNGPSMKPTLLPGDKIEIVQASFNELKRGDIIIYNSPENIRINIIHRIIDRDSEGLMTRGDNNSIIDPYRVRPEHKPLRVVAFKRGSRRFLISKHGIALQHLRMLQNKIKFYRHKYFYPLYVYIAASGFFYPFGKIIKTEIRKFKRPKGIEYQLFISKYRIGILAPGMNKWNIIFPWKLFIKTPAIKK